MYERTPARTTRRRCCPPYLLHRCSRAGDALIAPLVEDLATIVHVHILDAPRRLTGRGLRRHPPSPSSRPSSCRRIAPAAGNPTAALHLFILNAPLVDVHQRNYKTAGGALDGHPETASCRATMVISIRENVVDRYVQHATADMYQNNRTDKGFSCRRSKLQCLFDPSSGILQDHLLRRGFMEVHTQWMSDDEEGDHENNEDDEEDHHEEERHHDDVDDEEAAAHDDGDQYQGEQHVEDADINTSLTSVMWDPHLQELLLNQTTTDARAIDR